MQTSLVAAIAKFPKGAFVKLSSRSPKDAVDKLPHLVDLIAQELQFEKKQPESAQEMDGKRPMDPGAY